MTGHGNLDRAGMLLIAIALFTMALIVVGGCNYDVADARGFVQTDCGSGGHTMQPDTPWIRHTITKAGTPAKPGADGVDINAAHEVVSPFEEGNVVTVSRPPYGPTDTIDLVAVGGYEDAKWMDVDGDGQDDVVAACQCNKVTVYFAPTDPMLRYTLSAWTTVQIAPPVDATHPARQYMQLAVNDVDNDGFRDIAFVTRVSPAVFGWFKTPASSGRVRASWLAIDQPRAVDPVGWGMSVIAHNEGGHTGFLLSDRAGINPGPSADWSRFGSRWIETADNGATWTSHRLTTTEGDGKSPKFDSVGDFDHAGTSVVVEGRGLDNSPGATNKLRILRNNGFHLDATGHAVPDWFGTWSVQEIGDTDLVGNYQSNAQGDLDGNGTTDIVVSYAYTDGTTKSGVIAMMQFVDPVSGIATWDRQEISGREGIKFDNTVLVDMDGDSDLDVLQSEQGNASIPTPADQQLGVVWYENPRQLVVPGVCANLSPDAPSCCAGMLGCTQLPASCLVEHQCVTYLCPEVTGDVVRPGICAP